MPRLGTRQFCTPKLEQMSFGLETEFPNKESGVLRMGHSGFALTLRINTMRERHNGDNELLVSAVRRGGWKRDTTAGREGFPSCFSGPSVLTVPLASHWKGQSGCVGQA